MDLPVILALVAVLATIAYFFLSSAKKDKKEEQQPSQPVPPEDTSSSSTATASKKPKRDFHAEKEKEKERAHHPLLLNELKGHTSAVLHFALAPSNKQIASCSEDRTIRLWDATTFSEKNIAYSRINIDLDHVKEMHYTLDSKACIAALASKKAVRIYKVGKKELTQVVEFPEKPLYPESIKHCAIAGTDKHKYALTSYTGSNTHVVVWDLAGNKLLDKDMKMMVIHHIATSPCGKYFGVSGFTTDVILFNVNSSPSREFLGCAAAMDLKGHSSGIYHFAFTPDSQRVATVSKDGTWRLFNINVRWEVKEECGLLASGKYTRPSDLSALDNAPPRIAASPDGYSVVVAVNNDVIVYSGKTGAELCTIPNPHKGWISCVDFQADSRAFMTSGADKHIAIWKNTPGLQERLKDLEEKRARSEKKTEQERLQDDINEIKSYIA